jgi:hypothetical protein
MHRGRRNANGRSAQCTEASNGDLTLKKKVFLPGIEPGPPRPVHMLMKIKRRRESLGIFENKTRQ